VKETDNFIYSYNGLGDRLKQTENSAIQNYTLDLDAGLTQILRDGKSSYFYGIGRIGEEQQGTSYYYIDDVLDSVRQIVGDDGVVILAQTYEPFGNVMIRSNTYVSTFQFTGEIQDETGLIYLRQRYYSPTEGKFVSRDIWDQEPTQPISYNAWLYGWSNPIRYRDPSGLITQAEAPRAQEIVESLVRIYGIGITQDWGWRYVPTTNPYAYTNLNTCPKYWVEGNWRSLSELERVKESIEDIAPGKMSINTFQLPFQRVEISRTSVEVLFGNEVRSFAPPGILATVLGDVVLGNYAFDHGAEFARFTAVHELGHVWDYRSGDQLSFGLMQALDTWICEDNGNNCHWAPYFSRVDEATLEIMYPEPYPGTPKKCGDEPPSPSHKVSGCEEPPYAATYGGFPLLTGPGAEDWAESFASYVYPNFYPSRGRVGLKSGGIRETYIEQILNSLP
jgi:RHS repeat-associated protein